MGRAARTIPGGNLRGKTKALRFRPSGWSRSPARASMSPHGGRQPRHDTELPRSHLGRVSRWSGPHRGGATSTWWSLADAAPDLDRSRLAFRRAADHVEKLSRLLLECLSIVGFDVQSQERLGVGRPYVEPPCWKVQGHSVQVVDLAA